MTTFGIELEILPKRGLGIEVGFKAKMLRTLQGLGLNAVDSTYMGRAYDVWQVKYDSTVKDVRNVNGYRQVVEGCEIVSPVLTAGPEAWALVRKVCDALTEAGATAYKACGMHVHVGIETRNVGEVKNIVRAYGEFKDQIDSVLPRSRRESQWCRPVWRPHYREAFLQRLESQDSIAGVCQQIENYNSRYSALSLSAYRRIGTIEFRQHSGTCDADKAVNWAQWCVAFVEHFSAVNVHSQPVHRPMYGQQTANVIGRGEPRMPRRGDTRAVLLHLQAGGVLNNWNIDRFLSANASRPTASKWVKQIARSWGHSFVQNDSGDWALAANYGSEPATVVEPFQQCFNIGNGLMAFFGRRRAALA